MHTFLTFGIGPFVSICAFSALASPVVFLIAIPLGIEAKVSSLAPRLGLTVLTLAGLLLATFLGELTWFTIHPPQPSDPGINGMLPFFVYAITGGPLSFVLICALVRTAQVMIRKRIEKKKDAANRSENPRIETIGGPISPPPHA